MTIDPDVAEVARQWAGEATTFPALLQAVVLAEGNILRAVQCTYPSTTTRADALQILARSATHAMSDFLQTRPDPTLPLRAAFVHFWAHRWAPLAAANDPHGLNANWPGNVLAAWIAA